MPSALRQCVLSADCCLALLLAGLGLAYDFFVFRDALEYTDTNERHVWNVDQWQFSDANAWQDSHQYSDKSRSNAKTIADIGDNHAKAISAEPVGWSGRNDLGALISISKTLNFTETLKSNNRLVTFQGAPAFLLCLIPSGSGKLINCSLTLYESG